MNDKKELIKRLKESASIKTGNFKLTSGKSSTFYIDIKQFILSGHSHFLACLIANKLSPEINIIAGTGIGGALLVGALLTEINKSKSAENITTGLVMREETRTHGTQKILEGPILKQNNYATIVEDVITTGKSVISLLEELKKNNIYVNSVISIVNRCENKKLFEDKKIQFISLLETADLL